MAGTLFGAYRGSRPTTARRTRLLPALRHFLCWLPYSNGAEFVKTDDNEKVIVASFTAVLALSTIGLWLATVSLQRTTNSLDMAGERQLDLARIEFLATHRPRIRFRHVWLLSELKHDTPLIGHVTCTNTGPA